MGVFVRISMIFKNLLMVNLMVKLFLKVLYLQGLRFFSQMGIICEIINSHGPDIMIKFHINFVLVWENGGVVWKR